MKRTILTSIMAAVAAAAVAIPPRPAPYLFTNTRGDTLRVRIAGAPRSHTYTLADNGTPLVRVGDRFFIPTVDPTGRIVASATEATPGATLPAGIPGGADAIAEGLRRQAATSPAASPDSRVIGPDVFPTRGKIKVPAILVYYTDVPVKTGIEHLAEKLNSEGYDERGVEGSIRQYFLDNSWGQFDLEFDVLGPVKLPHNRAYYGANGSNGSDIRPEAMALDACRILNPTVDFGQYDNDGDGFIDNVCIIYAGESEADGSGVSPDCVWPHQYNFEYLSAQYPRSGRTFDGKILDSYACLAEWQADQYGNGPGRPDGISTFIHEFSHVLGLPDLYSTNGEIYQESPYYWSILDMGSWLDVPPAYSAFERASLGWIEPEEVTGPMSVTLDPLQESQRALRISTSNPDEYFLLETRYRSGWDKQLYGSGLLIWHIDYKESAWYYNTVNNQRDHQRVDLIRADNSTGLTSSDIMSDPFPGASGRYTSFTPTGTPSFTSWADGPMTAWPITDIQRTGAASVSFNIAGGSTGGIDDAIAPDDDDTRGAQYFDLRGIPADIRSAAPGIYIRRNRDGSARRIMITPASKR